MSNLFNICLKITAATLAMTALLMPGFAQQDQFETTKVAEGVYSFRYLFHRNMFVVTDEGVIVTDPMSPKAAAALNDEIQKITDKPVKYVIYSHEHWDHALGGQIFKDAGAKFIAQENCSAFFEKRPNKDLVAPDETYADSRKITLGGKLLELNYFGRNHGNCMTVIHLPEEKLLYSVDIISHKRVAYRTMPDYFPADWVRSLNEIDKLDFERIIPGHGAAVIPRESVQLNRQYIEDLMAAVKTAMNETGDPEKIKEIVKLPQYKDWVGYDNWLPLNIERIMAHYSQGW